MPARPRTPPVSSARSTPGGAAEPNVDAAYQRELAQWKAGTLPHARITAVGGKIKVHFHVINNGSGLAHGDIPQSQINDQMAVLNAAYTPARGSSSWPTSRGRPTRRGTR